MRVLLIASNTENVNMPVFPLGLHLVAEAVRAAGHDVREIDLLAADGPEAALNRVIQDLEPEVIGVSVRNIDDQSMTDTQFFLPRVKAVIDHCRKLSPAPIILGGAGYSIFPHSALAYLGADLGLQGEGEVVFPELLHRLESGQSLEGLSSLCRLGPEITCSPKTLADLNDCPLPSPQHIGPVAQSTEDFWMPYQTRRGCPLNCSYCSTGEIEGCRLRQRRITDVRSNLKQLTAAGVRRFYLVDNTFNLPSSYALSFCRAIIDAGLDISWRCILYPSRLSPELVQDMARAGCQDVSLGFESGNAHVLAQLNKKFTQDCVRHDARLLAEYGIKRLGFLLLGGPGETRDTVEESLEFAESLELEALKITAGIRIYPRTKLDRRARAEGLISPDDSLLFPRFYLRPELDGWLQDRISEWSARRPGLVM